MDGPYDEDRLERLRRAVDALSPRWGFEDGASASLLSVSENATYRVEGPDGAPIAAVRVHRPAYHGVAEIESELAWIEALRADGVVPTPRPLPLVGGGSVASFVEGGEIRRAVAFEFVTGSEPEPGEDLGPVFRTLGAIGARLHRHARRWRPPAGFSRKRWDVETILGDAPHWGRWQDVPGLGAGARRSLGRCADALAERLGRYGDGADRFGLVHAALRLANLLVGEDGLSVIDFDDCGFAWYGFDFAAAISFFEEAPWAPALMDAWCEGYRTVAALADADAAMLPTFVMLRRMQLTAWLATRAETPTAAALGDGYLAGTERLARAFLDTGSPFGTPPARTMGSAPPRG